MSTLKTQIERLLAGTGITLNGPHPWDLQIKNEKLYERVLAAGSLGLGEAYMDGWWECDALDELFTRVLTAHLDKKVRRSGGLLVHAALARLTNRQSRRRAFKIGEAHYDLGNDLYRAMLDARLTYTCGYWQNVADKSAAGLNAAQEAKLDLVCRKIGLDKKPPGQHVLDIGCGWGSFAKFAAEKYGARVTGITVSQEQLTLGRERCAGLPVELRLQDYRDVTEKFDNIISLGMFEHVGVKNYRTYMRVAARCLTDGGLFLLHTIGGNTSVTGTDAWIEKYIFPNSMLPSAAQITTAAEGLFVLEDWHSFGADYDTTLMAWHENFSRAWSQLASKYNERFRRMWSYYLLSCAGSFRARRNQLWQIVFSKNGVHGGYQPIR